MDRPNILLIMADQLDPAMTGCYGNPVARTPHLDALAAEGTLFTAAYTACPICAPARMSLLTGKYVSEIGCNDNMSVLCADEPTHNHYLNTAGYDTVLAGKMHAVGPDQLHGFKKRLNTDVYPADFNWLAMARPNPETFADAHEFPIAMDYVGRGAGVRQWSLQLDYDEETHFRAQEYLRSRRSRPSGTLQKSQPVRDNTPFFLQVSYQHPHEPFHCTQEYWDRYEDADIPVPSLPENMEKIRTSMDRDLDTCHGCGEVDLMDPESLRTVHRSYLASVSYFDDKVGSLIQCLRDNGLYENTVIILTSDHGDMLGRRGMIQKRCFYEHSSCIPLVVRIPERYRSSRPAASCPDPVSITDILPTVLDLAGVRNHLPVDGESLQARLYGDTHPARAVFCENHSEGVSGTCFMVRRGTFKYNLIYGSEEQLFNVVEDPEELNNLAADPQHEKLADELKGLILERFNPDRIERELTASIEKRKVLKTAMDACGGPSWAFQPFFNAEKMYWRKG